MVDQLPEPKCESGYPHEQLEEVLGDDLPSFHQWMAGQTMTLCTGRKFDHDAGEYNECCGGIAHGPVVYPWDLRQYLESGRSNARISD